MMLSRKEEERKKRVVGGNKILVYDTVYEQARMCERVIGRHSLQSSVVTVNSPGVLYGIIRYSTVTYQCI